MKSTIEVKSIKMNRSGDPDSQATLHKLVSSHCGRVLRLYYCLQLRRLQFWMQSLQKRQ